RLCSRLRKKPAFARSLQGLLKLNPDLVVEAASQEAVRSYSRRVLECGASLLVLSCGALLDEKLFNDLQDASRKKGVKLIVPSGAVGGLDALRSASVGRLKSVVLTTTKPAKALGFKNLKKPKIVFEGSAKAAVVKFPRNANVAAAVSLAGIGGRLTKVRLIADPGIKRNSHEVVVKGDFGHLHCIVENVVSSNPKTSLLAAFSAVEGVRDFGLS
ncbi:MAG: aspartate dehydrogenase, partial [Candidatus Micrarchaeia archaeon]